MYCVGDVAEYAMDYLRFTVGKDYTRRRNEGTESSCNESAQLNAVAIEK
jgi:CRP-like cAMP-binding protein